MVSSLANCSDGCGWIAAILAALSWGTFGVPLKMINTSSSSTGSSSSSSSSSSPSTTTSINNSTSTLSTAGTATSISSSSTGMGTGDDVAGDLSVSDDKFHKIQHQHRNFHNKKQKVEVNFFVMQSYKTFVCFVTCWFVLLLGEECRFTPWGIVSGIFWVPGAACGIYGIRNAGLAVAVGTWSSIIVVSSFLFGIVIFQERVRNVQGTIMAFCLLLCGLIGMSRYSDPTRQTQPTITPPPGKGKKELLPTSSAIVNIASSSNSSSSIPAAPVSLSGSGILDGITSTSSYRKFNRLNTASTATSSSSSKPLLSPMEIEQQPLLMSSQSESSSVLPDTIATALPAMTSLLMGERGNSNIVLANNNSSNNPADIALQHRQHRIVDPYVLVLFGGRIALTKRQLGVLGAIVNGGWGGLNLIPLHYAQRDEGLSGAAYLISYATGSMIVCISIWIIWFGYYYYHFWNKQQQQYVLRTTKTKKEPSASTSSSSSASSSLSILSTTLSTSSTSSISATTAATTPSTSSLASSNASTGGGTSSSVSATITPFTEALNALPKLHVRELGIPGLLAGLLYSFGNFCSILAVAYLGQGVGYSFCQSQLLISGCWGVFYFHEITGKETILKWFGSALVAIVGIIWLSYEHLGPDGEEVALH